MDNRPTDDPRIVEALEACRPGSDDVADPAMAHLADALAASPQLRERYERLQRLDAKLVESFGEVPIPEGLQQRLIERLAAAEVEEPTAASEAADVDVTTGPAAALARPKRRLRRWLWAAGVTLSAAAAMLLILAWGPWNRQEPLTESAVLSSGVEFFNTEAPPPGELVGKVPPPAAYPFSRAVRPMRSMRWRRVSGFLGRSGIAYDLPAAGGGVKATLYVFRCRVPGLPLQPRLRPGSTTAGCAASAWMSGGRLYVLVVRGNTWDYQKCLVPTRPYNVADAGGADPSRRLGFARYATVRPYNA